MAALNPANGPIPKPRKKAKTTGLSRGGRKPKEAGRRYERKFADQYGFRRQVGSGAFGPHNPDLLGDVIGDIGHLKLLFENKSWDKVDGRGEKVVSFPVALLTKISKEAELLGRIPIFIYHVKGASDEWAVVKYEWLHDTLMQLTQQIAELEAQILLDDS